MKVSFIPGDAWEKALSSCYKYLKEKYRREKLENDSKGLWEDGYAGAAEERMR